MNAAHSIGDWRSQALWWSLAIAAGAVASISAIKLASFDFPKLGIVAVAVSVALLLAQFRLRIPKTESTFYPKTVFSFWGIALLGVWGGALLALVSSSVDARGAHNFQTRVQSVARDVVASFASAIAFYYSLSLFPVQQNTLVAGKFLIPNEVIFAAIVMAAVHFAAATLIDLLALAIRDEPLNRGALARVAVAPSIGHLVSLAVALVLFLTFNNFGIEFGLVLLPLAIAANAAHRIHVSRLEQKTREITEASRLHFATVEALATAIDARDQVGAGHVRRTQIYAVGLGRLMDLPETDIDALRTGALLHDIGKLAVPDHILNKPGRLTQAEMDKTKIHSSVGASMLEKVGFKTPVVPTVKYHHEHWDGNGYPEGLRGTQIPLTARILSVSDAFDTLRGARPYRPAVSREDACGFLRAGAGSQFDPKLVDLLLRNLKPLEDEIAGEGLMYETETSARAMESPSPSFVEQIKRANHEVFTLYSLARDFSGAATLDETMALFTDKIGEFVPYDACAVYISEEAGDFASAMHVDGPKGLFLFGKRVKIGEGATGYAIKKNKRVENVDPALDLSITEADGPCDFKTMISRPLVADDKVIGAISLYTSRLPQYQDEHLRLLDTVSPIAADAIGKLLQHQATAAHAMTDPITGLPNARSLQAEFEKEVKRSARNDSTFQLLMLDLDGFKAVNDTFGHKVGDKLLTAIGGVIRAQLRDYDFLARYAGDEFVALIPGGDADGVGELCQRIQAAVTEFGLAVTEDDAARVGVSIGSASYPAQGESFDQLIIFADKAMYGDKAARKQQKTTTVPAAIDLKQLLEAEATAAEFVPDRELADIYRSGANDLGRPEHASGEILVVELDESHVIATTSVN